MSTSVLTPPELGKQWGIAPEKVLSFIRNGSLRAFDVSSPGSTRPRYRIPLEAIVEFESRRSARTPAKVVRRKKTKQPTDFVTYF